MDAMVQPDTLAYILSRIQFGLSVGVHFIFPTTTLGLAFFILVSEFAFVRSGEEKFKKISTLGVKFLGMIFAMGVATGIVLPFAFGTNWSGFVDFAGSVFGTHLVLEAVLAFTVESIFLGVLLFGRNKVSKNVYLLSAILVFLGSHLSGFIIISANAWMQTPFHSIATLSSGIPIPEIDGFHIEQLINGKEVMITSAAQLVAGADVHVVLDNVMKVVFNPTAVIRFLHTAFATWLTGSVLFAAFAAGLFLKQKHLEVAKSMFRIAVVVGLITALAMPLLGHQQIMKTYEWQPTKDAAMEGIFKTQDGAPLHILGWVDPVNRKTYAISIPGGVSFLVSGNFKSRIEGLDDLLAEGQAQMAIDGTDKYKAYAPPVQITFQALHIMVLMGVLLIAIFVFGAWAIWKRKWDFKPWVWKTFFWAIPMPYIAVEFGWIGSEIGRQPWVVYGLLFTKEGVSNIPAGYVIFSLIIFTAIYTSLFVILAKWIPSMIKESLE